MFELTRRDLLLTSLAAAATGGTIPASSPPQKTLDGGAAPLSPRDDALFRTLYVTASGLERVSRFVGERSTAYRREAAAAHALAEALVARVESHTYSGDREIVERMNTPDGSEGPRDEAALRRLLLASLSALTAAVDLASVLHGECPDGCVRYPDGWSYCCFSVSLSEWATLLAMLVQRITGPTSSRSLLTAPRRVRPTDWATASRSLQQLAVNAARRAAAGA